MLQLLLIHGQVSVFFVLQLHEHGDDSFYGIVIHQHFHSGFDHQILNPFFADRFLLAIVQLLLDRMALVVAVYCPVAALATLSVHGSTAMTTEQLGGQQIGFVCLGSGGCFSVLLQLLLYPFKQVKGNNGRDAVGNDGITECILTNIAAVAEHMLDRPIGQGTAFGVRQPLAVEVVSNLGQGMSFVVHLKGFHHIGGSQAVRLKMLLIVHHIANGEGTAVPLALFSIDGQATDNIFFEVLGVPLSHALKHGFQQNTIGSLRNGLVGRNDSNTILTQLVLVFSADIAVTGKSVQLPYDNEVKMLALAVLNHLLKFGSVISCSRDCSVGISANHRIAVAFSVCGAIPNLSLNGFLPLAARRVSGIYDGSQFGHIKSPL